MEQVRGQQSTIYTVCGAKTLVEALGPFGQTIQTTNQVGGYCCFQQFQSFKKEEKAFALNKIDMTVIVIEEARTVHE